MALKTLNNFKAQLTGGGARPNLFEVSINYPTGGLQTTTAFTQPITAPKNGAEDLLLFMVKAAALPALFLIFWSALLIFFTSKHILSEK